MRDQGKGVTKRQMDIGGRTVGKLSKSILKLNQNVVLVISVRSYLSLGRIELHESDGLQSMHLEVIGVLTEGCFHHGITEHMSPL